MSTEAAVLGTRHDTAPRAGALRYFFVALGIVYISVAAAGFTPSYLAYSAGTRDIHWFAHVHGAIMSTWLAFYVVQAALAAFGSLRWHRTLGAGGVALGCIAVLSMATASIRVRLELHPPVDSFLWDVLARELVLCSSFALFFGLAVAARRDGTAHKRWITLATAIVLQSAIDRLPVLRTLAGSSSAFVWLYPSLMYVLVGPLAAFDLATRRRVHRVTIVGIALITLGFLVTGFLTGRPAWHELAYGLFNALD